MALYRLYTYIYTNTVCVCEAITPNKSFNAFAISESQRGRWSYAKRKRWMQWREREGTSSGEVANYSWGSAVKGKWTPTRLQDSGFWTQIICHRPHSLVAKEITLDLRLRQNGRRKLVQLNGFGHGYPGEQMDGLMPG